MCRQTEGCNLLRALTAFNLGCTICHITVFVAPPSPPPPSSLSVQKVFITDRTFLLSPASLCCSCCVGCKRRDCNNVVNRPPAPTHPPQHPFQETASNQGRALGYFALSCPFLSCSNSHLSSSNCSLIFFGKLSIQHFQLCVKFAVHSGRQWMYKSLSHLDITSSRFCLTHSVLKCACVIVVVIFISGCV